MESGQGGTASRAGIQLFQLTGQQTPPLCLAGEVSSMWHTCKCHGNACLALRTGFESWFYSSVIFYLS